MSDRRSSTDNLALLVALAALQEVEHLNFLKEVEMGMWTEEELRERERKILAETEKADNLYRYLSNFIGGPIATLFGIYAGLLGIFVYGKISAWIFMITEAVLYVFLVKRCWTKGHEYLVWAMLAGLVLGLILIKIYVMYIGVYN